MYAVLLSSVVRGSQGCCFSCDGGRHPRTRFGFRQHVGQTSPTSRSEYTGNGFRKSKTKLPGAHGGCAPGLWTTPCFTDATQYLRCWTGNISVIGDAIKVRCSEALKCQAKPRRELTKSKEISPLIFKQLRGTYVFVHIRRDTVVGGHVRASGRHWVGNLSEYAGGAYEPTRLITKKQLIRVQT